MSDKRVPAAAAQTVTASITLYGAKVPDIARLVETLLGARSVNEVYLIDNTPRGRRGARIGARLSAPRVHYIRPGRNIGFGRGHNLALEKILSVSKYHLVVNLDTHFESSAIDAIADYMDNHPGVGAVTRESSIATVPCRNSRVCCRGRSTLLAAVSFPCRMGQGALEALRNVDL